MKRSSLILISSVAAITMAGLLACGSKDSNKNINSKNIAKPNGDVSQKVAKDQSGAISLTGSGVLSLVENGGDPFGGSSNLNLNLKVEDSLAAVKSSAGDSDLKAIAEAKDTKTFMNLGCKDFDASKVEAFKDLAEKKAEPKSDINLYTASKILICGKVNLNAATTITAETLYFRNADVQAHGKVLKLVIRAETISLVGDVNTVTAPNKTSDSSSLDLVVTKQILGKYDAKGEIVSGKQATLTLAVAKAKERGPRNPLVKGLGSKAVRPGSAPTADAAPVETENTDIKNDLNTGEVSNENIL